MPFNMNHQMKTAVKNVNAHITLLNMPSFPHVPASFSTHANFLMGPAPLFGHFTSKLEKSKAYFHTKSIKSQNPLFYLKKEFKKQHRIMIKPANILFSP